LDDPVKNNLARNCKILRIGEGLARRLQEKDCGKKENIAGSDCRIGPPRWRPKKSQK